MLAACLRSGGSGSVLRCAVVLCVLSLFVFPFRRASAGSNLLWSFCYYGSDSATGWSVTISGSFQSGPLNVSQVYGGINNYRMLSAMGVRTQYDASGAIVSSVDVIGVAPMSSTQSQNDNLVQTQWPVLTSFGVSFVLDGNITVPGVSPAYSTSLSSISGGKQLPTTQFPPSNGVSRACLLTVALSAACGAGVLCRAACGVSLPCHRYDLFLLHVSNGQHRHRPPVSGSGPRQLRVLLYSERRAHQRLRVTGRQPQPVVELRQRSHQSDRPVLVPLAELSRRPHCVRGAGNSGAARVHQRLVRAASEC